MMNKKRLLLIVLCLCIGQIGFSQNTPSLSKLKWLIGEWRGEGDGKPGLGEGSFSFQFDLDNKILIRKSCTEFPSKTNSPTIHKDLLILYSDFSGNMSNAIYFDNEGHTINYMVTASDTSIVFLSERVTPNIPIFRLTYTLLENNQVNTKFEMSQDGITFTTYIEGKSKKVCF